LSLLLLKIFIKKNRLCLFATPDVTLFAMLAVRITVATLLLSFASAAEDQAGSLLPSLPPSAQAAAPMTAGERLHHFAERTFGTSGLIRGLAFSGFRTWQDRPEEWPANADGFSRRFASRFGRLVAGNAVQMGIGYALNDDPRYRPSQKKSFKGRLAHALLSTFWVYGANGNRMPAYSRFAGVTAGVFIESIWLPPSVHRPSDCAQRAAFALSGNTISNVLREFWPDIKRKLKRD
jgi:hypothetical protein